MVINILKDGSRIEDLTGHVVKLKDATTVYSLINEINKRAGTTKVKIGGNK